MTKAKQELLQYKTKHTFDNPSLQPTDLIPLINKAWNQSFAQIDKNCNTIANRGWNHLNRNILLDQTIWATMTNQEKEEEFVEDMKLFQPKCHKLDGWRGK